MFLQTMNQEEKEKFLELVYKIANIDGDYAEDEEEIVNHYKIELGIKEVADTMSIEELISYFENKEYTLKKIVLFEVIGLVNADDVLAKVEEEIISLIKEKFAFKEEVFDKISRMVEKLNTVYEEIYDVIFD